MRKLRSRNNLDLLCTHITSATVPIEAYVILRKPIAEFDSGRCFVCYLCKETFDKIMDNMEVDKFSVGFIEDYEQKIRNYE